MKLFIINKLNGNERNQIRKDKVMLRITLLLVNIRKFDKVLIFIFRIIDYMFSTDKQLLFV